MTNSMTNSSINMVPSAEKLKDRIVITASHQPWVGVQYTIGEVSFPDENEPIMSFEYELISGEVSDREAFEKYIGDELVVAIERALKDQTIVFKGGV